MHEANCRFTGSFHRPKIALIKSWNKGKLVKSLCMQPQHSNESGSSSNFTIKHFLWNTSVPGKLRYANLVGVAPVRLRPTPLQWRHNGRDGVSNHQPHDCLLNRLFRCRSKKTKLRVAGLCEGNLLMTGDFPAQRASSVENVSSWWPHHVFC